MLASKYRPATDKDLSEIRVLTEGVIRRLKCDDAQVQELLNRYSRDNLEAWILDDEVDVLVGTYMGFVIGVCFLKRGNLLGLFVEINNKNNHIESSLWSYARDVTLAKSEAYKLTGDVLSQYVKSITDHNDVSVTEFGLFSQVSENLTINDKAVTEAKESLAAITKYSKRNRDFVRKLIAIPVFLFIIASDLTLYIFYPNEKLERIAYQATLDVNGSAVPKETKDFWGWQVDLLLWRGAQPAYTKGDNYCYGAFGMGVMWFNPELLAHLTKNMNQEDKASLLRRCSSFIEEFGEQRKQMVLEAIGYEKGV